MEYLYISPEHFKIFLLVFIRVASVLLLFPFFDSDTIPGLIKAGLTLVIAFIIYPSVPVNMEQFPTHVFQIPILILSELIIGLALGTVLRMFYTATQIAGQLIGFQAGFGMMNVVDPQSGTSGVVTSSLGLMAVSLIFLLLNGHHVLIMGLIESYRLVDIGSIYIKPGLLKHLSSLSADMFILGLKIGAPAVAALLFVSVAFGLSAKFSPQMNILIVAFPIKIAVGLFFFGMTLHIILLITRSYVSQFDKILRGLLTLLGGG